jgi:glycosyltransferase involved in cell wall biosynthesis
VRPLLASARPMCAQAKSRYAFIQRGSFSRVNELLRPALDDALDPLQAEMIDVKEYRRVARGVLLNAPPANISPMFREFGRLAIRQPRTFINRRSATSFMFDHASQQARARASRFDAAFIFQTQTVFDARLPGKPFFIYTDHTVLANRRYPRPPTDVFWSDDWLQREHQAYEAADCIFTSSAFARTSLIEDYGCRPEQVNVVGSGVNLPIPGQCPDRNRRVRNILFLGLEWERKGGPELVRAFRRLRGEVPDLTLTVAGAAPKLCEPGVKVLGRVSGERISALMLRADVFCMPSHLEPSAGVYLEAAAHGLPVVATSVGGTPERVIDGVTGYLCQPGDDIALTGLLRRLVNSPEHAAELGASGYAMIRETSTWPLVARRISSEVRHAL